MTEGDGLWRNHGRAENDYEEDGGDGEEVGERDGEEKNR